MITKQTNVGGGVDEVWPDQEKGGDELITESTILFRGHSEVRRYSNIAIRN